VADTRNVKLKLGIDGRGHLHVDGHDLSKATRGVSLQGGADQIPQLTIDLIVFDAEVEIEGAVTHIPAATVDALVTLGWTPPGDGE
jgi:hypothetical protein